MWFKIYFYFTQIILYAEAMVGENVREAKPNEFPFIVSIKLINPSNLKPETDHGCTGIILSPKDVLTVAHGFDDVPLNKLEVVVGSNDIRLGRRYYPYDIITYNSWATKKNKVMEYKQNDIAILKIAEAMPSSIVPPVLNSKPHEHLYGLTVVTAGWGWKTNYKSRFMETVCLKLLTPKNCKERLEKLTGSPMIMQQRYLCTAAKPYAFLRKGDSGGPLLLGGELIGINKASAPLRENDFHASKVNIHISVLYYKEFILDNLPVRYRKIVNPELT